ncbi:hypothetical protein PENSPDRAFT_688963 [Peniophora sp. CONT]|nr:hypothetical protein PENSPDRAFT_688963 [Peniophora sp. CONT]
MSSSPELLDAPPPSPSSGVTSLSSSQSSLPSSWSMLPPFQSSSPPTMAASRRKESFGIVNLAPLPHPTDPPTTGLTTFCPTLIVPSGELFKTSFLDHLLDQRGNRLPLIWTMSPYSCSKVDIETVMKFRQNFTTEAQGVVIRFIARDERSILFQLNIVGWNTGYGWRAPNADSRLVSFAVVPLERCAERYTAPERFAYFTSPAPLLDYAYYIAKRVHTDKTNGIGLPNDPVTTAMHESFLMLPDLGYFHLEQGTGAALTEEDHRNVVRSEIGPAPPDFNPHATRPPYLVRYADFDLGLALQASIVPGIGFSQPVYFSGQGTASSAG